MMRRAARHRALILLAGLAACAAGPAVAQTSTKAGLLTCRTGVSIGLIFGSHQRMQCRFVPNNGGPSEFYAGAITRLGVDLGISAGGVMTWAVVAPTNGLHHGALRGNYVGASGDISLGVGVGANVLVGGSHKSVALQPLSVEGQVGVNLALGVAGLALR